MTNELPLELHESPRGNLYVGTGGKNIPFEIQRFYVIRDVPPGETRGTHAHRTCEQAVFALNGSFDILIDDGKEERTVHMDSPTTGVRLPPKTWHSLSNFSPDCVALVLSSEPYRAEEYIHDYEEFKRIVAQ